MFSDFVARYIAAVEPRTTSETLRTMRHRCAEWSARMGDNGVSQADLERFRDMALREKLAPATIEAVIHIVRRVMNFESESQIDIGRRLFVAKPSPDVPTYERIDAIYRKVSAAKWPRKLTLHQRCEWWRTFVVTSCWTGFRISDLGALTWNQVGSEAVTLGAWKTRRYRRAELAVPITITLRRHLNAIKRPEQDRVFGLTKCLRQLRNELERIAEAAGVEYVPPHGFRRFAVNAWTAADPLAGQLIQGQRLGSMDHYLNVYRHLARVAPSVEMPEAFYTAQEIAKKRDDESSLLQAYRAAKSEEKRLLLDLARRLA